MAPCGGGGLSNSWGEGLGCSGGGGLELPGGGERLFSSPAELPPGGGALGGLAMAPCGGGGLSNSWGEGLGCSGGGGLELPGGGERLFSSPAELPPGGGALGGLAMAPCGGGGLSNSWGEGLGCSGGGGLELPGGGERLFSSPEELPPGGGALGGLAMAPCGGGGYTGMKPPPPPSLFDVPPQVVPKIHRPLHLTNAALQTIFPLEQRSFAPILFLHFPQ